MLSRIALAGIWAYQRYLSPRKGYRCAYAVAHGGTGCSGYTKFAIRDHGIWHAWPLIRARFAACRTAHATLRKSEGEETQARKQPRRDCVCDSACGGVEACGSLASLPGRLCAGAPRSSACDTNPCDGDVGCGACQVDICSCG